MSTVLRGEEERVTPLELFFDLVFVLAHHAVHGADGRRADLGGAGQGPARARRALVVVGRLRVADQRRRPRGGRRPARDVRRDGALLVVALCVPEAFGDDGAAVRRAPTASCASPRSCCSCSPAATTRPAPLGHRPRRQHGDRRRPAGRGALRRRRGCRARSGCWRWRSTWAGPYLFGVRGLEARARPLRRAPRPDRASSRWASRSSPSASAPRPASTPASSPPRCSAIAVAAALWWLYFDVVALVAERRLANAAAGRERNEIARDSFSYLHFPMVAGIVLSRSA